RVVKENIRPGPPACATGSAFAAYNTAAPAPAASGSAGACAGSVRSLELRSDQRFAMELINRFPDFTERRAQPLLFLALHRNLHERNHTHGENREHRHSDHQLDETEAGCTYLRAVFHEQQDRLAPPAYCTSICKHGISRWLAVKIMGSPTRCRPQRLRCATADSPSAARR